MIIPQINPSVGTLPRVAMLLSINVRIKLTSGLFDFAVKPLLGPVASPLKIVSKKGNNIPSDTKEKIIERIIKNI